MYSVYGDTILDPFSGTGTTTYAAMGSCRNSIGVEIDGNFRDLINGTLHTIEEMNKYTENRISNHHEFTKSQTPESFKYTSTHYGFPVKTKQEKEIFFYHIDSWNKVDENSFALYYSPFKEKTPLYQPSLFSHQP
jgi:hypothetical protein